MVYRRVFRMGRMNNWATNCKRTACGDRRESVADAVDWSDEINLLTWYGKVYVKRLVVNKSVMEIRFLF